MSNLLALLTIDDTNENDFHHPNAVVIHSPEGDDDHDTTTTIIHENKQQHRKHYKQRCSLQIMLEDGIDDEYAAQHYYPRALSNSELDQQLLHFIKRLKHVEKVMNIGFCPQQSQHEDPTTTITNHNHNNTRNPSTRRQSKRT